MWPAKIFAHLVLELAKVLAHLKKDFVCFCLQNCYRTQVSLVRSMGHGNVFGYLEDILVISGGCLGDISGHTLDTS